MLQLNVTELNVTEMLPKLKEKDGGRRERKEEEKPFLFLHRPFYQLAKVSVKVKSTKLMKKRVRVQGRMRSLSLARRSDPGWTGRRFQTPSPPPSTTVIAKHLNTVRDSHSALL